jgi:hypothetical protein
MFEPWPKHTNAISSACATAASVVIAKFVAALDAEALPVSRKLDEAAFAMV